MLDLAKLSFEEVVEQLKSKLREKPAWKDVYLSSTGTVLIEFFAYVLQLLLYYLKRTAEEQFIATAQYWESLVRIANMLGLYVHRPKGTVGLVEMRLRQDASIDQLFLDRYTKLLCDGVPLYLTTPVLLQRGEWTKVEVKQGERKSISFKVTDVREAYFFEIPDTSASDEDLEIRVGNEVYIPVTDLFDMFGEKVVRIYTMPNKKLCLAFLKAFAPLTVGQTVDVYYSVVVENWRPPVNTSFALDGIDSVEVRPFYETFQVRGKWESVDELRTRLSYLFFTGKRMVTKGDIEKLMLSVPGVEKVRVINVTEEFRAPFLGVRIIVKPQGGWTLTPALKADIDKVVSNFMLVGIKPSVEVVSKVDIDVYVVIRKRPLLDDNTQKAQVQEVLLNLYRSARIGEWIAKDRIVDELTSRGIKVERIILPEKDMILFENQLLNLRSVRVDFV